MKRQAAWALLALASCGAANAAGPYFHLGNGGVGDWSRWSYPAVTDSQTQQITFQLFSVATASDTDMHLAFGLRGGATVVPCPASSVPGVACTVGRGIVFGYFQNGLNPAGPCQGVAVEHFTNSHTGLGPTIIGGTCVSVPVLNYHRYDFTVNVTTSNVSWSVALYERDGVTTDPVTGEPVPVWAWVANYSGGCQQSAGVNCAEYAPADQNYADVFVASAFLNLGKQWRVENLYITHF